MLDSVVSALPDLAVAGVVVTIFVVLGWGSRAVARRVAERHLLAPGVGEVLGRIAHTTIVFLGLLVGASIVVPSFRAGSLIQLLGIGSITIGFAFKEVFQNFLAGLLLLLTEPFRIGDEIMVGGLEGVVDGIQSRATTVRTADGRRVVVPNSDLFTQSVTVNTAFPSRRSEFEVDVPMERVGEARRTLPRVVAQCDGVLPSPSPDVIFVPDSGGGMKLRVRWWTAPKQSAIVAAQDRVVAAVVAALRGPAQDWTAGDEGARASGHQRGR